MNIKEEGKGKNPKEKTEPHKHPIYKHQWSKKQNK